MSIKSLAAKSSENVAEDGKISRLILEFRGETFSFHKSAERCTLK